MSEQILRCNQIRIDGGTQMRAALNQEMINDMVIALEAGDILPDPVVFFDSLYYWLADGFHRYHAHEKKKRSIKCDVREGTQRDAILYAAGANTNHGLRRSAQDKQVAIRTMLLDAEWAARSDNWIASVCKVSHHTVGAARKELAQNSSQVDGVGNCQHGESESDNGEETATDQTGRQQPRRKPRQAKERKFCTRCQKNGPARDCIYCEELNGPKKGGKKAPKSGEEVLMPTAFADALGKAGKILADLAAKYGFQTKTGIRGDVQYNGLDRKMKEVFKEAKEWCTFHEKRLKKEVENG